jgi:hypothetical protein
MLRKAHLEQVGRAKLHFALLATHWLQDLRRCGWFLLHLFLMWRASDGTVNVSGR